jgi:predicted nuclease of predicted toxin-antitoxin system
LRLLANENVPAPAVEALTAAGHDVVWIRTASPGVTDRVVLERAVAEQRVLLTFDKDFGELAFRFGLPAICGVVLFRIRLRSPQDVARFAVATLGRDWDWVGHFSVVEEGRVRSLPLPGSAA